MEWRLLHGIPPDDVRALISVSRRRTFARGEVVFHRGDPADALHLVVKGRFEARVTTSRGDEVALGVRGAGDAFGELAPLTGEERSATVAALEPGETLCVRWDELRRLAARRPAIGEVLVRLLAEQVHRLSELLVEAYTVDAEIRVARRLRELSEEYGAVVPLTQEQLAGLAGASRATVNRVLRRLERGGVLSLGRGRTEVVDRDALARAAGRH